MSIPETMPMEAAASSGVTVGGIRQAIWLTLVVLAAMMAAGWVMLGAGIRLSLAVHLFAGILLPALIFVRWRRRGLAAALRLHWCGMRPLVFGMMLGVGTSCVGSLVQEVLGPFPLEYWPIIPRTWGQFGWALLICALGPGICEEVLFRGVIQGVLSRRGRWPAILISALLFGALHLNAWQLSAGFLMGTVMGWMVERSGSLFPAIAGHAMVNAIAFATVFANGSPHAELSGWVLVPLGAIGLLGLMGFLMFTRESPGPDSAMKTASAVVSKSAWLVVLVPLVLLGGLTVSSRTGAWSITPIGFDVSELQIEAGESAIALNRRTFSLGLQPGDGVLFVIDGVPGIGIVRSVAGASVTVDQQGALRTASSETITDKIVHVLRLPWWSDFSRQTSTSASIPR